MRIFLILENRGSGLDSLILTLAKKGHEIVYCVGLWDKEFRSRFPKTIWHDHFAARLGQPADSLTIDEFPPVGEDLIEKMYRTESLVLTMMNKRHNKMCVDERRHLYYNMLQYWHGVIKKYQPDLIFFPDVPNVSYAYIIFALAEFLKIKITMLDDTLVSDRALMYNNFWQGSISLQERLKLNKGKIFSLKDLSLDLQDYYRLKIGSPQKATPFYVKKLRNRFSKANLLRSRLKFIFHSLKNGNIIKVVSKYLINHLGASLKREYTRLQIKFDFNRKFVYVPLHNQPERTTSPHGDMFSDQILMIEILAASLPKGWVIYVKESPVQWLLGGLSYSASRYLGYYEKIAKMPNVYLVPLATNTFSLIDKSQAVATVGGGACWEAVLRLKSAIIFGYPWYRDCPAIFKVNDVNSCKEALNKVATGFIPNQQDVINYLKSFDEASIHCNLTDYVKDVTKLTKEERVNNIIGTILNQNTVSN